MKKKTSHMNPRKTNGYRSVNRKDKRQTKFVWCGLSFIDLHFSVGSSVVIRKISIDKVHHVFHKAHSPSQKHTMHQTTGNSNSVYFQARNNETMSHKHTHTDLVNNVSMFVGAQT